MFGTYGNGISYHKRSQTLTSPRHENQRLRNKPYNIVRRPSTGSLLRRKRLRHRLRHTLLPRRIQSESRRHLHPRTSQRIHAAPHPPRSRTIHQQQRTYAAPNTIRRTIELCVQHRLWQLGRQPTAETAKTSARPLRQRPKAGILAI